MESTKNNTPESTTMGDVRAAVTAGVAIGEPKDIGELKLGIVLPPGHLLHTIDLEEQLPRPVRKRGDQSFATADSFIRYVKAHAVAGTAIYADKDTAKFRAVINGHEPEPDLSDLKPGPVMAVGATGDAARAEPPATKTGDDNDMVGAVFAGMAVHVGEMLSKVAGHVGNAGWADFTAGYNCPLSREWKRWNLHSQHAAESNAKKGMRQEEFMQFLEDNLPDISRPEAAVLLAAVRSFEAKKDVKFKSSQRAENGDIVFAYSEETSQAEGKVSLPEAFELTIPVFEGGNNYVIEARLRFRIKDGGLALWYELVRPHKVLEHAFNTVRAQIAEALPDVPLYDE